MEVVGCSLARLVFLTIKKSAPPKAVTGGC